ncbi:MAG: hypothetical protein NTV77_01485 [Candidatus Azambacteria bacterium]|nr:hypothetical protein [Candidatus Azambacteria bacterium]
MVTKKQMEILIGQLKKMPIVQIACEKSGISRTTFYRRKSENMKFRKTVEAAIIEGESFITDISESQLISLIKDKNFPALHLWLRHHHPKYAAKIEITTHSATPESLTPRQKAVVREALKLVSTDKSKLDEK